MTPTIAMTHMKNTGASLRSGYLVATPPDAAYTWTGRLFAATFDGRSAEPRLGRPTPLFADEYDFGPGITTPNYDTTPDGGFIFLRRTPSSGRLHVVLGWLPELERLIAAGGARP